MMIGLPAGRSEPPQQAGGEWDMGRTAESASARHLKIPFLDKSEPQEWYAGGLK